MKAASLLVRSCVMTVGNCKSPNDGSALSRSRVLTWIVERSFAWLGRNRRFSKDYEYMVQTSESMIAIAATRIMLNRLAPA